MSGQFQIDVDPVRNLVHITMSGFFTRTGIDAFLKERARAFARLTCGPNQHLSVTDLREMKIQSQDMVAAFREVMADPAYRSRRLAFVVASTLARMQLLRTIGDRGDVRCFTDMAEAEAWLLDDAATLAA